MRFRERTIDEIADMVCGNVGTTGFVYLTGGDLTRFFREADTDYRHDGSTRAAWVAACLKEILAEPCAGQELPYTFCRVIALLMDLEDASDDDANRAGALAQLNKSLGREGFEAFYAEDRQCYLRQVATQKVIAPGPNPHRPFSAEELRRREQLTAWLETSSEDEMIEEVLLPLFRQLGFQRITAAGHKDKALEYGKDIWMRFVLPTLNVLYFGIQAKKGKLDAAGMSSGSNRNVAEIHAQVQMMLGHEIFDPEINKRVLVDHAFIIAGGQITKAARAWIGNALDNSKRSQIMFLDRDDLLNLYTATGLPVPGATEACGTFGPGRLPFKVKMDDPWVTPRTTTGSPW